MTLTPLRNERTNDADVVQSLAVPLHLTQRPSGHC